MLIGSFADFVNFYTDGTAKISHLETSTSIRTTKYYTYVVLDGNNIEFTSTADGSQFTSFFQVWNSGSQLYSFKITSKTYYTDTKIITSPTVFDPNYSGDHTLLCGKWTKITVP